MENFLLALQHVLLADASLLHFGASLVFLMFTLWTLLFGVLRREVSYVYLWSSVGVAFFANQAIWHLSKHYMQQMNLFLFFLIAFPLLLASNLWLLYKRDLPYLNRVLCWSASFYLLGQLLLGSVVLVSHQQAVGWVQKQHELFVKYDGPEYMQGCSKLSWWCLYDNEGAKELPVFYPSKEWGRTFFESLAFVESHMKEKPPSHYWWYYGKSWWRLQNIYASNVSYVKTLEQKQWIMMDAISLKNMKEKSEEIFLLYSMLLGCVATTCAMFIRWDVLREKGAGQWSGWGLQLFSLTGVATIFVSMMSLLSDALTAQYALLIQNTEVMSEKAQLAFCRGEICHPFIQTMDYEVWYYKVLFLGCLTFFAVVWASGRLRRNLMRLKN